MNLLNNYIYIYHLDKFCVLPEFPETITDSMSSTFTATDALARSAPVQTYSKSGPRTVNFTLDLHRDMMEELNANVSNMKDSPFFPESDLKPNVIDFTNKDYVDILLNYLQACALPKYNVYKTGAKAIDPPQVAVRIGNEFFIRGVISGAISVTYKKPILDNGKYASAQVTLTITEVDPYDAPTVAMAGGFRGITSTFKRGIYKDDTDSISYYRQDYAWASDLNNITTINTNPPGVGSVANDPRGIVSNTPWMDYLTSQRKEPGYNSLYVANKKIAILNDKFGTDASLLYGGRG